MRVLGKIAKIAVVAVMVCCSLLFVACNDKPPSGVDEGRVYGVGFITGVEGVSIDAQVVSEGERVIEPEVPLRAGYKFVGWKVDGVFWNFSSNRVFSSFELVAVWEVDPVSWAYTDGLKFAYNQSTKNYDVVGYEGVDEVVELPLYYSGDHGGHAVGVIADSAFAGNSQIKKIVLSSGVGASAFAGSAIEEVVFESANINIGASAFSGTTNLKSVTFKNSTGSIVIGASAFAGSGLTTIVLPDSVTQIGASAFAGSSINSVKFGSLSKLKVIGASAFYNTKLVRISIPAGVETIEDNAFRENHELLSVVFPSGLKVVGRNIFTGCENLDGIYFTGATKSKALAECDYWNLMGVNEYFYSDYDKGVSGCWRGFDANGDPIKFVKNTNYTIDLNAICEHLTGDKGDYKIVVKAYYLRVAGVYGMNEEVVYFGENYSSVVVLDQYKITSFSVEVFDIDNNFHNSNDALMKIYDLKVDQTHIIASDFDGETKMIII